MATDAVNINRKKKILDIGGEEVRIGSPNVKNTSAIYLRSAYINGTPEAEELFQRYFGKSVPAAAFTKEEYDILLKGIEQRINGLTKEVETMRDERGNATSVRTKTGTVMQLQIIKDRLLTGRDAASTSDNTASSTATATATATAPALAPAPPISTLLTEEKIQELVRKFAILVLHYQRPLQGMNAYTQPAKNVIGRLESITELNVKTYVDSYRSDGGILSPIIDDILEIGVLGVEALDAKLDEKAFEAVLKDMTLQADIFFEQLPAVRDMILKSVKGGSAKDKVRSFLDIIFNAYIVAKNEVEAQNKQGESLQKRVEELIVQISGLQAAAPQKEVFDALKADKIGLESQLVVLKEQIKKLEETGALEKAEIEKITKTYNEVNEQFQSCKAARKVAENALAAVKNELGATTQTLEMKNANLKDLEVKYASEKTRATSYLADLSGVKVQLQTLQSSGGADKSAAAATIGALVALKQKYQDISANYFKAVKSVNDLSGQLGKWKKYGQDLSANEVKLRNEIEDLSGSLATWETYKKGVNSYQKEVEEDLVKQETEIAKLSDSLVKWKDYGDKTAVIEEELKKEKGKYAILSEVHKDLSGNYQNLAAASAAQKEFVKKLETQLQQSREDSDEFLLKIENEMEAEISKLEAEITMLKRQIAAKEQDKTTALTVALEAQKLAIKQIEDKHVKELADLKLAKDKECTQAIAKSTADNAIAIQARYAREKDEAITKAKLEAVAEKQRVLDIHLAEITKIKTAYDSQISVLKAEADVEKKQLAQAQMLEVGKMKTNYDTQISALKAEKQTAQIAVVASQLETKGARTDTQVISKKLNSLASQILTGNFSADKFGATEDKPIRNILQKVKNISKEAESSGEAACALIVMVNHFFVKMFRGREQNKELYDGIQKAIDDVIDNDPVKLFSVISTTANYLTYAEKVLMRKEPGFYILKESDEEKVIFYNIYKALSNRISDYIYNAFVIFGRQGETPYDFGYYHYDSSKSDLIKTNNFLIYDPANKTFDGNRKSFPFSGASLNRFTTIQNGNITPGFTKLNSADITGGLNVVTFDRQVSYHLLFAYFIGLSQRYILNLEKQKKLTCLVPETLNNPFVGLLTTDTLDILGKARAASASAAAAAARPKTYAAAVTRASRGGTRSRRSTKKKSRKNRK